MAGTSTIVVATRHGSVPPSADKLQPQQFLKQYWAVLEAEAHVLHFCIFCPLGGML